MDLPLLDGTSFMKERQIRKEVFYDEEMGFGEIYKTPSYPDRVWLRAGYFLDLTKTRNLRRTIDKVNDIFVLLKDSGFSEVYCIADSQSSFRFNERVGFSSTQEIYPKYGLEIMKRVL